MGLISKIKAIKDLLNTSAGTIIACANQELLSRSPFSEIHWMDNSTYRMFNRVLQWSKTNDANISLSFESSVYLKFKYKTKHPLLNIQNGEVFFDGVKIERMLDFSEIARTTQ